MILEILIKLREGQVFHVVLIYFLGNRTNLVDPTFFWEGGRELEVRHILKRAVTDCVCDLAQFLRTSELVFQNLCTDLNLPRIINIG